MSAGKGSCAVKQSFFRLPQLPKITCAKHSNVVFPNRCLSRSAKSSYASTEPLLPVQQSSNALQVQSKSSQDQNSGDLNLRLPKSVQAAYLQPLKRKQKFGIPSCDLQLRSYSVRNLEFMTDFALRAAYYLKLPARGPVPLPQKVERWTVIRSNFVHKKSQENFERKTLRRLVQIQDGHPETVQIWLAYLRKHQFYGVGMKANVWEHEPLNVSATMDNSLASLEEALESKLSMFGRNESTAGTESIMETLDKQKYRQMGVPLTTVREGAQSASDNDF